MVDDTDTPEIDTEKDPQGPSDSIDVTSPDGGAIALPITDFNAIMVDYDPRQISIQALAERTVAAVLRSRFPQEKVYYNVGVQVMPTGQGQMGAVLAIVLAIDHMVIGERIVVPLIFPQPVVRDEDIEQHVAAAVEQAREIRAQSLVLPPQG